MPAKQYDLDTLIYEIESVLGKINRTAVIKGQDRVEIFHKVHQVYGGLCLQRVQRDGTLPKERIDPCISTS